MAIDNHPRIRQAKQLARKKAKRETYDRILIVSEGEKTEVLYFEEIRKYYKLATTHVKVCRSDYGTTPLQVVEFALDLCQDTREWEKVFCVIDRDDHPGYEDALNKAKANNNRFRNDLKQPIEVTAIPSNPNFELWLVMHFAPMERNIHRDQVVRLLQDRFIPGYEKGRAGVFETTRARLETAYANAARAKARQERQDLPGMENPSTCVDELVRVLCELREK
ncbi:RloB family protein [Paraburkholderia fungorum]